ncbi:hypothetical protein [Halorarius halobius]|uniref:hypothetical protein n=1 Tax=Halorarius halobius TaxID=2962671 RepID=UPI0020CCBF5F|nr:hypothetical protein [Halorarius halobius]
MSRAFPERVAGVVDTDREAFAERVAREAETLKGELEVGTFDNTRALVDGPFADWLDG